MVETQVATVDSGRFVDALGQELLVKADQVIASEGKIELTAYCDKGQIQRILLSTTTSSARRAARLTVADVRRLASDVQAKVRARLAKIDWTTRRVIVTLYPMPNGAGFEIEVSITDR